MLKMIKTEFDDKYGENVYFKLGDQFSAEHVKALGTFIGEETHDIFKDKKFHISVTPYYRLMIREILHNVQPLESLTV